MSEIYLHLDGQQKGPYSEAEIRNMVAAGLPAETPAWHPGLSEWSTVAALAPVASSPPPVPPPVPPMPPLPQAQPGSSKGIPGCWLAAMIVAGLSIFLIPCLAGIALGPITNGIKKAKENASMQTARAIDLAMYSYASDHNGAYPDGQTSTEVFQKLLDEKYVADPALFYLSMPGKIRPTSNKLSAENVCYDVTSGITADSSDDLPIVFSEGYNVTYSAGASATLNQDVISPFPGMAVAYKSNRAHFYNAQPDGTVPEVVPDTFVPGKGTYRQLKP